MNNDDSALLGQCHCGNLEVAFQTQLAPEQLQIRACSCSFCIVHGAITTSDPKGHLTLSVRDPSKLNRYQFALRTSDFILCGVCGVFMAATFSSENNLWSTLNINTLKAKQRLTQQPVVVNYDHEDTTQRTERRKVLWTPTTLRTHSSQPVAPLVKVNLAQKFAAFQEVYRPKITAQLNGQYVKVVKFLGPFAWHKHDHEDEMFLVVEGRFRMELRHEHVWIEKGEFIVIPRGVEHRPVADEQVEVVLFEPATTLNTGDVRNDFTLEKLDWI